MRFGPDAEADERHVARVRARLLATFQE